jgi:hypothetical protein
LYYRNISYYAADDKEILPMKRAFAKAAAVAGMALSLASSARAEDRLSVADRRLWSALNAPDVQAALRPLSAEQQETPWNHGTSAMGEARHANTVFHLRLQAARMEAWAARGECLEKNAGACLDAARKAFTREKNRLSAETSRRLAQALRSRRPDVAGGNEGIGAGREGYFNGLGHARDALRKALDACAPGGGVKNAWDAGAMPYLSGVSSCAARARVKYLREEADLRETRFRNELLSAEWQEKQYRRWGR